MSRLEKIKQLRYNVARDYARVYEFLTKTYNIETLNSYLIPQYFEYAQHHFCFDDKSTHRIGLWEDNGRLVGISTYEMQLGEVHLHTRPNYEFLLPELLSWAESEMSVEHEGLKRLKVWVTDSEVSKIKLLNEKQYSKVGSDTVTIFDYKDSFLKLSLPSGYKLISSNEVDATKLAKCYHEGFNNEGEMTKANIDGILKMNSAPNVKANLTTVIVAPNGDYASALGMWLDEKNNYAYLEPLATVPEYRRKGLATFALMHAMKRTKEMGATYCFGGGVMNYYPVIGFKTIMQRELWEKKF